MADKMEKRDWRRTDTILCRRQPAKHRQTVAYPPPFMLNPPPHAPAEAVSHSELCFNIWLKLSSDKYYWMYTVSIGAQVMNAHCSDYGSIAYDLTNRMKWEFPALRWRLTRDHTQISTCSIHTLCPYCLASPLKMRKQGEGCVVMETTGEVQVLMVTLLPPVLQWLNPNPYWRHRERNIQAFSELF